MRIERKLDVNGPILSLYHQLFHEINETITGVILSERIDPILLIVVKVAHVLVQDVVEVFSGWWLLVSMVVFHSVIEILLKFEVLDGRVRPT